MEQERYDIIEEATEVADIGERKSQLEEAAEEINLVVPEEEAITREQIESAKENIERIAKMVKSPEGKYKVIGVNKFSGADWVEGKYDTPEEALGVARRLTEEKRPLATSHKIAIVYYAYDPDGNYLGGDTWVGE